MSTLEKRNNFAIITLGNQGLFNATNLAEINAILDDIFDDEGTHGLVFTGQDKVFAQGLDLDYIMGEDPEVAMAFVYECLVMIGRLLASPIPVCTAANGHAFGLGAMITLASDYKVMREDRGYFCLPEIDMGMNLIPPMNALVCHKLSGSVLRDVLLTGKRIGGSEAQALGIVDKACPVDELIDTVIELAAPMTGKNRKALSELKTGINQSVLDVIARGQG